MINYQPSFDLTRPDISMAAIIGLSALIAIYLLMRMGLCFANLTQVAWAGSVDSHSIMRITVGLCSSFSKDKREKLMSKYDDILDVLPGQIGNAEPDAKVSRLVVGADTPLKWGRRYWKGDDFAL